MILTHGNVAVKYYTYSTSGQSALIEFGLLYHTDFTNKEQIAHDSSNGSTENKIKIFNPYNR